MHFPATTFDRLALDQDGRIGIDVRCFKCGYNLRAQSRDGRCPECGEPVLRTLSGYRLCYGDPHWVARLARGFKRIEVGALMLLLVLMFIGGSPLFPWTRTGTRG